MSGAHHCLACTTPVGSNRAVPAVARRRSRRLLRAWQGARTLRCVWLMCGLRPVGRTALVRWLRHAILCRCSKLLAAASGAEAGRRASDEIQPPATALFQPAQAWVCACSRHPQDGNEQEMGGVGCCHRKQYYGLCQYGLQVQGILLFGCLYAM